MRAAHDIVVDGAAPWGSQEQRSLPRVPQEVQAPAVCILSEEGCEVPRLGRADWQKAPPLADPLQGSAPCLQISNITGRDTPENHSQLI